MSLRRIKPSEVQILALLRMLCKLSVETNQPQCREWKLAAWDVILTVEVRPAQVGAPLPPSPDPVGDPALDDDLGAEP